MSDSQLTRDAEKLLCLLYKVYLQRRKDGLDKLSAKQMGSFSQICASIDSPETPADTLESCRELGRAGYLQNLWASNRIIRSQLTDKAIILMENRFKNGLLDVLAFLSQFVP